MMTEVRSYNGHGEHSGHFALSAPSGDSFLAAMQDAVRENPVPAALIGMGVVWMFMGGGNVSLLAAAAASRFSARRRRARSKSPLLHGRRARSAPTTSARQRRP